MECQRGFAHSKRILVLVRAVWVRRAPWKQSDRQARSSGRFAPRSCGGAPPEIPPAFPNLGAAAVPHAPKPITPCQPRPSRRFSCSEIRPPRPCPSRTSPEIHPPRLSNPHPPCCSRISPNRGASSPRPEKSWVVALLKKLECQSCPPYSLTSIKPLLRGLSFPPMRRVPPLRPTFLSPFCRDLPTAPYTRGASRRYATSLRFASPGIRDARAPSYAPSLPPPRGASRRSGDGRPGFGHGPAADAAGRGLRRGLANLARRHACGVHGWARVELARLALARLRLGRGPRQQIGGVLRGDQPRSSALRASGGGARIFSSGWFLMSAAKNRLRPRNAGASPAQVMGGRNR